ncbi:carboxylesterase family protein [Hymenobacter sp. BRD128]|uniref:alpha/beta hydrolase fold domain-containing protein n=1 Tax=Hymenobacter sp. BRD128 TaxID=2675878 RepID=UPI0015676766|nr:alpha/beta hydrolase fold domain-containing protein [Hymenobacter sp. BRD128]QKG58501.1 carboxylesterase family protein [Hymenobacter sp. BRD128]
MKLLLRFLTVLLLLASPGLASAQLAPADTTGGRYYQPVFATVTVTSGVAYATAPTYRGTSQTLTMDIYQPAGDTVKRRPLIIFAHQGGFLVGSKTDAYMVAICTRMARLGYVAASIDYRLGFPLTGLAQPADTAGVAQAAIRGMQDMRAAVRFFRSDAATTKAYRVYSNYIVVGGSSAGAFMALETGYLDKPSEVPAYAGLAALGGIEGTGGNGGYSSAVAAVLNLSGATESPSIIEAGNAPLCSVHGTADATVPYLQGRIGGGLPPKYVYGSGRLNPRATAVGVRNTLRRFSKAPHIPFESNAAYADTTFWTIRDFLRPLLRLSGTPLAVRAASAASLSALAYPTPARDAVQLALPTNWRELGDAQLLDMTGRVLRQFTPQAQQVQLARGSLSAGIYLLKFAGYAPARVLFE